jgi:hypothetical protein
MQGYSLAAASVENTRSSLNRSYHVSSGSGEERRTARHSRARMGRADPQEGMWVEREGRSPIMGRHEPASWRYAVAYWASRLLVAPWGSNREEVPLRPSKLTSYAVAQAGGDPGLAPGDAEGVALLGRRRADLYCFSRR